LKIMNLVFEKQEISLQSVMNVKEHYSSLG
jgi:hypothetical protein